MPSVYRSCTFDDATAKTLGEFNLAMSAVEQDFANQMVGFTTAIAALSSSMTQATRTIGVGPDDQITWTAVQPGDQGNDISIQYLYLGPELVGGVLVPRWPVAIVQGNVVTLVLGVDVTGAVGVNAQGHLAFWSLNPALTALVTGVLVGAGTDLPVPQPPQRLQGGKDSPVPDAETAALQIAQVFGRPDYLTLLRDLDVPVVTTDADAVALLNQGDQYCVVGGKLLIIEGTNLTGFNTLWTLYHDVAKIQQFAQGLQTKLPRLITTQMVSTTNYVVVCGVQQPLVTVTEVLRDVDRAIVASIAQWGDATTLRHYVVFDTQVDPSRAAYERLSTWGIPDQYIGSLLAGTSPTTVDGLGITAPTLHLVEDRDLFATLHLTNAQIAELLALNIPGVKVPDVQESKVAIKSLMKCPAVMANGARSAQRCGLVVPRAVNLATTFDDAGMISELATRGKACARTPDRATVPGFPAPPDLPNVPFDQLPNPAKKIESAFGAVSAAISTALGMFDRMIGAVIGAVKSLLDKMQNLLSLAENLLKNPLVECLLGVGTAATGSPEFGSVGGSGIPSLTSLTGGLPIPMALLAEAFNKMSKALNNTITSAFAALMNTVATPLCILQAMMDTLLGLDLGGLTNPCKKPPDNCPAEEVQAVVDGSTSMTATLAAIPSLEGSPTTNVVTTQTDTVQDFTGLVQSTLTESRDAVSRGVRQVMEDIQKSLDAKTTVLREFEKAIRDLFGETSDSATALNEQSNQQGKCGAPTVGPLMDQITAYI